MITLPIRRRLTALVATALLATPGMAQIVGPAPGGEAKLSDILAGVSTPMQITLKDVGDGSWRRFRGGTEDKSPSNSGGGLIGALMGAAGGEAMGALLGPMMDSVFTGVAIPGRDVFYTRGETVRIGDELFLVAYQPQVKELDLSTIAAMEKMDKMPVPKPMDASTPLILSLLNLRTLGSLREIRPVDVAAEISESEAKVKVMAEMNKESGGGDDTETAAMDDESSSEPPSRLDQIALGLRQYTLDYDDQLPPMTDIPTVRKVLSPYMKDDTVFAAKDKMPAIAVNPLLSKRRIADIEKFADFTVAFYETAPDGAGMRGVLFFNGRVVRVTEAEWQKLKRASRIAP